MLKYESLKKKPKEFLAATGLTVEEFEAVLSVFGLQYSNRYEKETVEGKARQRRAGGGGKANLDTMEDTLLLLLFILVYEKTYPLQTMPGLQFGLSQGRANIWIHRLLPTVREAVASLKLTPERDGQAVAHSSLATESGSDLVIDGTERPRVRPVDSQEQKDFYSGKKKPTPTKTWSSSTPTARKSSTCPKRSQAENTTRTWPMKPPLTIPAQPHSAKTRASRVTNPQGSSPGSRKKSLKDRN